MPIRVKHGELELEFDTVAEALEYSKAAQGAARRGPGPRVAPTPTKPGRAPKGAQKERVRRTPNQLQETMGHILKYVEQTPGTTALGIQEGLGLTNKEIQGPIATLLKTKAIRKRGEKRSTVYFAK